MLAKWQTMSECRDNQEVGLEAAILERVRNSSLVECPRADNGSGLKPSTETRDFMVGERSETVKADPGGPLEKPKCECRHK